jgi:hypothetical protein
MFSRLPDDPTLTAEQLAERENTEARKRLPEAGDLTSVCRNGRALYFRVSQELGLYAQRPFRTSGVRGYQMTIGTAIVILMLLSLLDKHGLRKRTAGIVALLSFLALACIFGQQQYQK